MTILSRLSIRQKLAALLMITSSIVLVVASIAYLTWDYVRFRRDMQTALTAQAGLVLDGTAAALTFNDVEAAQEALSMLSINPNVRMACLYTSQGSLFTEVRFGTPAEARPCPASVMPYQRFTDDRLEVVERLTRGRATGGMVLLVSDLEAAASRLRTQGAAVAAILVSGLLLSFLLSFSLQRIVARPIASLATTAREIAARNDYSIRAARTSYDEIGVLVDAFNRMLDEIEASQRERADLLEREQEANRLKDEFLATLSHELRTPLNAIVGWVHLLRRGQLPAAEAQHAIERIERNAQAQARLVQDLLDVSRITTGKMRLDVRAIDLALVVANAVDACRPAADARRVALTADVRGPYPTVGDPDRLQQILWNLITNAVRFTPPDGTVDVSVRREHAEDVIAVRDTGAGIDPRFLPHVFDPFRQADGASTRTHGGLGLGLTIVRRLAEMHGGTVKAASAGLGQGTTITVALPVRDLFQHASVSSQLHQESARLAGTRLLVVDDDADTLELLRSTLELAGADVVTAASATEALAVADHRSLDGVVSDIAMPGMDGYTLMALLRDQLGDRMPRVTIALTAYAGRADRERALAAGFVEHLSKPINPDLLLQTLHDLLAARSP